MSRNENPNPTYSTASTQALVVYVEISVHVHAFCTKAVPKQIEREYNSMMINMLTLNTQRESRFEKANASTDFVYVENAYKYYF